MNLKNICLPGHLAILLTFGTGYAGGLDTHIKASVWKSINAEDVTPILLPTEPIKWKLLDPQTVSPERNKYSCKRYEAYTVCNQEGGDNPYIKLGKNYYVSYSHCRANPIDYRRGLFFFGCSAVSGEYGTVLDLVKKVSSQGSYHLIGIQSGSIFLLEFPYDESFSYDFHRLRLAILNLKDNQKISYVYKAPSENFQGRMNENCSQAINFGFLVGNSIILSNNSPTRLPQDKCNLTLKINLLDMRGQYFIK